MADVVFMTGGYSVSAAKNSLSRNYQGLGIPAEALIQPYSVQEAAA